MTLSVAFLEAMFSALIPVLPVVIKYISYYQWRGNFVMQIHISPHKAGGSAVIYTKTSFISLQWFPPV